MRRPLTPFLSLIAGLMIVACAQDDNASPALPQTPRPEGLETTSTADITNVALTPTAFPSATSSPTPTIPSTETPFPGPTATLGISSQRRATAYDSKGHVLTFIPAGTFVMGLTDDQALTLCSLIIEMGFDCNPDWYSQEAPSHTVTLTSDYWIDAYEVTNRQYQACVDGGVCVPMQNERSHNRDNYFANPEYADFPVVFMTWYHANIFCQRWRGGRLPTEAEWEYAARGIDGRLWPWGNSRPDSRLANYWLEEFVGEFEGDTRRIGTYPDGISLFGLYDMAGNVEEWVADWYSPYSAVYVIDPHGSDAGTRRVIRGGDFGSSASGISSGVRYARPGDTAGSNSGFRCVIDELP